MNFRPLIFLGIVLSLGACATPPKFLSKPEQAALGTVDGIVVAPQATPLVTITPSNSGGGGLLGLLIFSVADGIRSANVKKESVPIIEALQGFNFQAELLAATTARVEALPNIKVIVRPTVDTVGTTSAARNLYDESKETSVLFFVVGYALVSGDLVLEAAARIYPKSAELNHFRTKPNEKNPLDIGNSIYSNKLRVVRQSVTPANIRANLLDAINQLAAQLAADLNSTR